jgi:hypothetical protein
MSGSARPTHRSEAILATLSSGLSDSDKAQNASDHKSNTYDHVNNGDGTRSKLSVP